MLTSPKISIIIPNYNHGRYLKQRIDSILDQTYKNIEVIILDDCSSDNSREIINRYTGNSLIKQIIFNEKNTGSPFIQWKNGLQYAEGEWIWFAESDDYADKRFLEILISRLKNNSNIGLIYCDSKIVSDNRVEENSFAVFKNQKFNSLRWSEDYCNDGLDEIENYLLPDGTINNSSAVLFNRKILIESDVFDLNLRYIGDKYSFIKVLSKTDVLYVKYSLNYYRNPFSSVHPDKIIFYFYEQFLVFNWVYKNLKIKNYKLFLDGFYLNTASSLFRNWSILKMSIYRKLFMLNPYLMFKNIRYSLSRSLFAVMYKH